MTNTEIIQAIKAEIERLQKYNHCMADNAINSNMRNFYDGEEDCCKQLLSFLSTLESEKPTNLVCEELDAYAQKVEDYYDVSEERGYLCTHRGYIKNAVLAGAKWHREQMMKEAVVCEAEVCKLADKVWVTPTDAKKLQQDTYNNFKAGDKVRIIIVKED